MITVGASVVVRITDPEKWSKGARECLDGKRGTVSRVGELNVLVEFTDHVSTWFRSISGRRMKTWWFLARDVAIDTPSAPDASSPPAPTW